jgi:hypothetical protein
MDDKSKTGPKPKELIEGTIIGLPIGRDKTVVPPDQVQELASLGCSDRDIANFYGVAENTLRYNFSDYLTKGREELKITLRRAMLKNACVNMSAAVQIFLAKNILGMTDQPVNSDAHQPLPWVERDDIEEENLDGSQSQAEQSSSTL